MSKILKNNTASAVPIADVGQTVPASGQLTIQPQDYWIYAASNNVITLIGDSTLTVNDGSVDLSINDGAKLVQGIFPNPVGVAAGDDGTPIGHVSDYLKVTSLQNKSAFDTSAGFNVGTSEISIVIPASAVKFRIQAADNTPAKLILADAANGTNSQLTSFNIYPGAYWEEGISGSGALTIYIKSSKANTDVQVVTWS